MLAVVLAATVAACATTGVTNVGTAEGYSIRFVSATPKPGTVLRPKDSVTFTITVRYDLGSSEKGRIALVFQNEKDELIAPGEKQQLLEVARGSHEVTLTQEFSMPGGVRELRLFVPLFPEGASRSSGELLLKYPVRDKP
jgi:hypothetical protein